MGTRLHHRCRNLLFPLSSIDASKMVNLNEVSLPIKTAMAQSKPNLSITHDDEAKKWEVNFSFFIDAIKVDAMKFDVGEEFDEKMPLGFTNKSVGVVEGDNLKITSKTKVGEIVRTFVLKEDGKELEIHLKCEEKGATAKRFFSKIE